MKANRNPDTGGKGPAGKAADTKPSDTKSPGKESAGARSPTGPSPAATAAPGRLGPGYAGLAISGLIGGLVGAGILLLAENGLSLANGDAGRIEALDKRVAALSASGNAIAGLDRRVSANEQALKPLPEAVSKIEASAKTATERADQALQRAGAVPAQPDTPAQNGASAAVPPDLAARLDALDQRVSALQEEPGREQPSDSKVATTQSGETTTRLADLGERLKALEAKGQAQGVGKGTPDVPAEDLAPKIAAVQAALDARSKADEAADEALDRRLSQRLDQLQQSFEGRVTQLTDAAKSAEKREQEQGERLAAIDKTIGSSAKVASVTATARAVAAGRIAGAVDAGAPYADALASLRANEPGDIEQLKPLTAFADTGAPTAEMLAEEFQPIAEQIAAERRMAKAQTGGIGDRLMGMAESLVQVKRVPATAAGTQPNATASSSDDMPEAGVQNALDQGRVDEAAKAFAALPEASRNAAKAFGAKLAATAEARAAAQSLQAEAFKALSAPVAVR